MIAFTKSNGREGGTWKHAGYPFKATVTCPKCKQTYDLRKHKIDPDGTVSPSLDCPTKTCTFHEYVKLENWTIMIE